MSHIPSWPEILGLLAAIGGLAFISLMEAALVSVNRIRLHQLTEKGHPTAPLVEQLINQRQHLLGGQVIMINACVLLAANLTTLVVSHRWGNNAVLWANLLVLGTLLLFGEITPKTLSIHFAETIALRTARVAAILNAVLTPLVIVLNGISFGILRVLLFLRILPGQLHPAPTAFSEEDIKQLVTAGEQSGEVHASERKMIHSVIEFSDTTAREIMVPRTDLIVIPIEATMEEAIGIFTSSGHSRIPVYEENADNILGILYIKDLLVRLRTDQHADEVQTRVAELLRPAYFVPETKKSDDLLREMQRKQVHLAIVVDEYGGTAGIITIEDLLEEIVGEIIDEYDHERLEVSVQEDGTAFVHGRASLEKIHETFDMEIPDDTEAETISGLLTEHLGRIPEVGDIVVINGVRFTVLDVQHNRIERLHAAVLPAPPSPGHSPRESS